MKSSNRFQDWASLVCPVTLLVLGGAYALFFLDLRSRWWFEDDPSLFSHIRSLGNPGGYFVNPWVLRHFAMGKALVPMQLFSYWVDMKLAGRSPTFAYVHQTCSFLLALITLYFIFVGILDDRVSALCITALWMLLPSTSVVLQFLATRHYLEGFLFAALAVLVFIRRGPRLRWGDFVLGLLCSAAAMLYKELYAATIPVILVCFAWFYRERWLGASTGVLVCLYAAYRFWMIGPVFEYGIPFPGFSRYLKFLLKAPYTLSSNYGGYVIFAMVVALCIYSVRRQPATHGLVVCFLILLAVSLAVILPVTDPLFGSIRIPDPWYRIIFPLNSIIFLFGAWLAAAYLPRRLLAVAGLIAIAALVPGAVKTQRLWQKMTQSAEREGKFYLNNPDKVLLSEQAAWWFIPGVGALYDVTPHYLLLKDLPATGPASRVWRYREGNFTPEGPR